MTRESNQNNKCRKLTQIYLGILFRKKRQKGPFRTTYREGYVKKLGHVRLISFSSVVCAALLFAFLVCLLTF